MRVLTERERHVLTMRRDQKMTFSQIARHHGFSMARARQVFFGALRKVEYPEPFEGIFRTATITALRRGGISTVEQLQSTPDDDLLSLPNFGKGMLLEVRSAFTEVCPNWVVEGVPA